MQSNRLLVLELVRRETRGSSGHGSIVLSAASVSPIDMVLYGTSTSIPFSFFIHLLI